MSEVGVDFAQMPESVAAHQDVLQGDLAAFDEAVRERTCPYLNELGKMALEDAREEVREAHQALIENDVDKLVRLAKEKAAKQASEEQQPEEEVVTAYPNEVPTVVQEQIQAQVVTAMQARVTQEQAAEHDAETIQTASVNTQQTVETVILSQVLPEKAAEQSVVEEYHQTPDLAAITEFTPNHEAVSDDVPLVEATVVELPKTESQVLINAQSVEVEIGPSEEMVVAAIELESEVAADTREFDEASEGEVRESVEHVESAPLDLLLEESLEETIPQVVPEADQPRALELVVTIRAALSELLLTENEGVTAEDIEQLALPLEVEAAVQELALLMGMPEEEVIRQVLLQLQQEVRAPVAAEAQAGWVDRGMHEALQLSMSPKLGQVAHNVRQLLGKLAIYRPLTA